MANKNTALGAAKTNKKDEFYTQLTDIEQELKHYRKHFKDKIVLCNCDDPFESNFFKYFVLNFNKLGLKKLIATSYATSPIAGTQFSYRVDKNGQMSFTFGGNKDNAPLKKAYKAVVNTVYDKTGDDAVDMLDVAELFESGENELTELEGDGDFRSDECIELLKQADIVCTNPPFSLFREYVAQLMKYDKKFVIIGNVNAITYKDFFPLLKDNMVWIGITMDGRNHYFRVPDSYPLTEKSGKIENGIKYAFVKGAVWYTNLDIKKRHEEMILVKKYNPKDYPKYDNYDAININSTANIPYDYNGLMGVPITFFNKYNPEQFEVVGYTAKDMGVKCLKFYQDLEQSLNGGEFVRNMKSARFSPMIEIKERPTKTCYRASNANGYLIKTYGRVIIRNKHPEQPKEAK